MDTSKTINASPAKVQGFSKRLVFKLLAQMQQVDLLLTDTAGSYRFGDKSADLKVQVNITDARTYRKLLWGGSIGAAEAYVEGLWTSDNLTAVIQAFSRNLAPLAAYERRFGWLASPFNKLRHRWNKSTKSQSRTNIAAHYDLSNVMYEMFLDPHMQYSSAIFPTPDASLARAQENKLRIICEELQLSANDHLLEVGTGWGGLACFAAKHYGCKVTTTTISQAQYAHAKQRIQEQALGDQVTLLLEDYRDLTGTFSKIVSVEMIEAVGQRFLPTYFHKLNELLATGGKLMLQAITMSDQRYDLYCKEVEFIQKYIFPGGHLPSVSHLCEQIKTQTTMRLVHFADYSDHYANTLKLWRQVFLEKSSDIFALGFNQDFIRLWEYYFSYCEGGFRESVIGLAQISFIKDQSDV